MSKFEYRVRPVTRFVVTEAEIWGDGGRCTGTRTIGEFPNEDTANMVKDRLQTAADIPDMLSFDIATIEPGVTEKQFKEFSNGLTKKLEELKETLSCNVEVVQSDAVWIELECLNKLTLEYRHPGTYFEIVEIHDSRGEVIHSMLSNGPCYTIHKGNVKLLSVPRGKITALVRPKR